MVNEVDKILSDALFDVYQAVINRRIVHLQVMDTQLLLAKGWDDHSNPGDECCEGRYTTTEDWNANIADYK